MEKTHFTSLEEQNKELLEFYSAYRNWNWTKTNNLLNGPLKGTDKEFVYKIQEVFEKRELSVYTLLNDNKFDYNKILDEFQEYYLHQFNEDLLSYYNFKPYSSDENIALSLHCDRHFNKNKYLKDTSCKRFCYFSLSVYFISLFPQVLGYLFGEDTMKDSMKCTGFPWLNCGLGGLLHPINILCESRLAPDDRKVTIEDYLFIFNKVRNFALDDFLEFFDGKHQNLNDEAYQHIVEILNHDDKKRLVKHECIFQYGLFRQWIMNPLIQYNSSIVSLK